MAEKPTHVIWTWGSKTHGAWKIYEDGISWKTTCGLDFTMIASKKPFEEALGPTCLTCKKVLSKNL